ncbi:hypothetical protein NHX12_002820 [Muraenolepis orangiensis]|uniref:Link domain-containing protein n=1 Tax=Muraenolepis orangiensis TaxID=630683 RepID=A0A9Q0IFT8_9TELE|nr:hypothetical protein NHX12_002820 [Muraenolepis orangiensis]
MALRRPLAAVCLLLLLVPCCLGTPQYGNGFYYHDMSNGQGNEEIFYNGVHLHVESQQPLVSATRGSSVTLPCHYRYEPELSAPRRTRINYGGFRGRVRLRRSTPGDMSLVIKELRLNDTGRYRCEVIDGVVFPYYSQHGRYHYNFLGAQAACEEQDATLATFEQLFTAWEEGLDWCNAGWLADGTVQYPITTPREGCGGVALGAGLRSYGHRHRLLHRYDAFCFAASLKGTVYFLKHPSNLSFTEAGQACKFDGGHIATVGQIYAGWRLTGLDRCDAGWLADGSVRYPITKARPNCGPGEPGVRSFGFPAHDQKYGVYCYRST